jgi:hypothetical protein
MLVLVGAPVVGVAPLDPPLLLAALEVSPTLVFDVAPSG